jgi:hypothetical protein
MPTRRTNGESYWPMRITLQLYTHGRGGLNS